MNALKKVGTLAAVALAGTASNASAQQSAATGRLNIEQNRARSAIILPDSAENELRFTPPNSENPRRKIEGTRRPEHQPQRRENSPNAKRSATGSAAPSLSVDGAPKLANGRSLDELNLAEGQVVVLDEKGNIIESYIEGKDGKKTPVDVDKLLRSPPKKETRDNDSAARNHRSRDVKPESVPEVKTKQKGFFGRLFGRGKNVDPPPNAATTPDKPEASGDRSVRQNGRSVLR